MSRVNLTEKIIDQISVEPGQREERQDAQVEGLFVRVYGKRDGTSVTFYWRRFKNGKKKTVQLGKRTPGVFTLQDARSEARKKNGELEEGKLDLAPKMVPTLSEAYQTFRRQALEGRVTEKALLAYDHLASLWGELGSRKIDTIKPSHVKDLHARLGAQLNKRGRPKHRTANKALQLLSRTWESWADDYEVEKRNPCRAPRRFREGKRDRVLSKEELAAFFDSLRVEPQEVQDVFEVLAFTGCRRANAAAMKFRDVDLDAALWTVPAAESKTRKPIRIPLVQRLVVLVKRRRKTVAGEHVFPARRADSKSPHVVNLTIPFTRICRRAGIEGVRIHDLRRTWASLALAAGAQQRTISDGLGHGDLASIASYAWSTPESVRDTAGKVAGELESIAVVDS